jgi:hypothetical protein
MDLEIQKITERIYYYPCSEEADRPNLGYIRGDNYSLMIDAGNSAKHAALFLSSIMPDSCPTPIILRLPTGTGIIPSEFLHYIVRLSLVSLPTIS